jgi:hypothetical protein
MKGLNGLNDKNISDLSFEEAMPKALLTKQNKSQEEALGVYKEVEKVFRFSLSVNNFLEEAEELKIILNILNRGVINGL